jgi:hypothetical protein
MRIYNSLMDSTFTLQRSDVKSYKIFRHCEFFLRIFIEFLLYLQQRLRDRDQENHSVRPERWGVGVLQSQIGELQDSISTNVWIWWSGLSSQLHWEAQTGEPCSRLASA